MLYFIVLKPHFASESFSKNINHSGLHNGSSISSNHHATHLHSGHHKLATSITDFF